jgi:uncharacterized protein (DUF2062 family)
MGLAAQEGNVMGFEDGFLFAAGVAACIASIGILIKLYQYVEWKMYWLLRRRAARKEKERNQV